MGEVYRARDSKLKRDVAIKILAAEYDRDPDRINRFQREAEVVASLNHPNIAAIYDIQDHAGSRCLILELVEGETLAERIERGPLVVEDALDIAKQICEALEAAHEKGIVHRDLKPGNIKVQRDGKVKILDFGLAKLGAGPASSEENAATLMVGSTVAGVILGTPGYMSPEQQRGEVVDKRADIWAFGVVLYEMLTGERLFEGKTMSDTLASVLRDAPRWERVPAKARKLVRACIEREPSRRLRDVGDAWRLLEESDPILPSAPGSSLKRAVIWGIVGALVSALAMVSLVQFRPGPDTDRPLQLQMQLRNAQSNSQMEVSPDGRTLLYSAPDSNGRIALWMRPINTMDAPDPRMLPGTEGVTGFFWSHDSRFVAFHADGNLKKADIRGGSPEVICEMTSIAGGSWNDSNILVVAARMGVFSVALSNKMPRALTKLDPSRKEVDHIFPRFLPDGRHFIYVRQAEGRQAAIFVGSLDADPEQQSSVPLLPIQYGGPQARIYYVPSQDANNGFLVVRRDNVVFAQPFNAKTLEVSGDAVPVSDQSVSYFTASTGIMLYGVQTSATELEWFERSGKRGGRAAEAGSERQYGLNISPDGTRVAIDGAEGGIRNVSVLEFESGRKTRITSSSATKSALWSPDGSQLVFASFRNGRKRELFRRASNGAGDDELLFSEFAARAWSWSFDGRSILLGGAAGQSDVIGTDLWILPTKPGSKPIPYIVSPDMEMQGQFSPDIGGPPRWVAYTSNSSGRNEVYVSSFPDHLRFQTLISKDGGNQPRWSRDGKELFYISSDNTLMSVATSIVVGPAGPIFKAGPPTPVFDTKLPRVEGGLTTYDWAWDVAPDGRFLMNIVPEPSTGLITAIVNWQAGLGKQ